MSTKEEKKYKLSVYLAKKSFKKDAEIITKIADMGAYVVKDGKGELGVLYLQTGYPSVPKWANLFKGVLPKKELDLTTKSARAVLIANVKQRKFCLTFGHAHFFLNPLGIERNFGLKVALNMGGKSSLRSVDKTSLEVVQIQSKEQSSKEVGIASFDFDYETDILKSITAKNEEGTATLSGRDSIGIAVAVDLGTMRTFLENLLTKYDSKGYKDKFSWVDNVSEVRDLTVVEQLDQLLVTKIQDLDSDVWLAVPEVLTWEDISGFAYKVRKNPAVSPDIHLSSWLKDIVKDEVVDIDLLRRKRIYAYDENYELYKNWLVYHCLNAEIDLDGTKYILNDGSWYAIDHDFVAGVNASFDALEDSKVILPPSGIRKEPDYNTYVATDNSDMFDLLDRKTIEIGGGRSSVEFCDLFSKNKQLIHVKKYGGSSVLSHLFQQGVVSGELFLSDGNFRNEVNKLLSDKFKLNSPLIRPNPADYEICYGIMSDVP
jgi:uncharacterized protein (TIGR04141 family)